MNNQEARKIIKTKAPMKYRAAAMVLLAHLVNNCFSPDGPRTNVTIKRSTLMQWASIGDDGLRKVLDRFTADGVGTFICDKGKVTVTLDLSPLANLPNKPTWREVKADRASKAREARAAIRQLEREARETDALIMLATQECWAAIRECSPATEIRAAA